MTRTSRTLLILVLMSIGTVVVLAMMAQRYSRVLEGRQKTGGAQPPTAHGEVGELPDSEAARYVAAYLSVMSTLKQAVSEMDEETTAEAALAELRGTFERALSDRELDRAGFQEMDGVVRAWEAGSAEVPEAYRRELDRRSAEVRGSRIEGYDPLER
jgi:hypothetical protein